VTENSVDFVVIANQGCSRLVVDYSDEANFDIVFNGVDFGVVEPRCRVQLVMRLFRLNANGLVW